MSETNELVNDALRHRAAGDELWVLAAWRASGLSPLLFSIVCGTSTVLIAVSPIWFAPGAIGNLTELVGSSLFFGISIAVLTGFTPLIFPGAVADLSRLSPLLDLTDADQVVLEQALVRFSSSAMWIMTAVGLALGLGHAALLGLMQMPLGANLTQMFGTVLIWLAMFWTIPPLLANAQIFSDLGRRTRPDLLNPQSLAPFGAAAIRPTLFVIGMLCAYPILAALGAESTTGVSAIGFVASFVSMFGLFFLPLRGIRHQIQSTRTASLARLDAAIGKLAPTALIDLDDTTTLARIHVLASTRDRIARVSSWPLDLAGIRRVLLYVVLPPMTWAAAALVELMIDRQF